MVDILTYIDIVFCEHQPTGDGKHQSSFAGDSWYLQSSTSGYPLVNVYKKRWKITIFNGKSTINRHFQ
jgi:hypothetical protein